jgi:hypothetical protein
MVFFILLVCGFLLVVASIYILIKTQKTKATVPNLKQTYKGILAIFLIGAGFVGAAFVIREIDKPKVKQTDTSADVSEKYIEESFAGFAVGFNNAAKIQSGLNDNFTIQIDNLSQKLRIYEGERYNSFSYRLSDNLELSGDLTKPSNDFGDLGKVIDVALTGQSINTAQLIDDTTRCIICIIQACDPTLSENNGWLQIVRDLKLSDENRNLTQIFRSDLLSETKKNGLAYSLHISQKGRMWVNFFVEREE